MGPGKARALASHVLRWGSGPSPDPGKGPGRIQNSQFSISKHCALPVWLVTAVTPFENGPPPKREKIPGHTVTCNGSVTVKRDRYTALVGAGRRRDSPPNHK